VTAEQLGQAMSRQVAASSAERAPVHAPSPSGVVAPREPVNPHA